MNPYQQDSKDKIYFNFSLCSLYYIQSDKILLLSSKYEKICIFWNVNFFNIAKQNRTFLYCSTFSYRSPNFAIAKVVALNLFALIFILVLYIGLWLLFCIALHKKFSTIPISCSWSFIKVIKKRLIATASKGKQTRKKILALLKLYFVSWKEQQLSLLQSRERLFREWNKANYMKNEIDREEAKVKSGQFDSAKITFANSQH